MILMKKLSFLCEETTNQLTIQHFSVRTWFSTCFSHVPFDNVLAAVRERKKVEREDTAMEKKERS